MNRPLGVLSLSLVCGLAVQDARAQEAAAISASDGTEQAVGAPAEPTIPVPVRDEAAVAPQDSASGKSTNRLLEEIVVTAQKREENLQDVPISVQAFSADQLDARGIEEPKALQLSTPGMQYNTFAGYSLIYIRGVGTDAFIPSADASVATYIDNIYYPFGHSLAASLGSIERVEVLKGPQGTLFGRNSTGGAINIVTKQPGQTQETSILLDRESYDKTNVRVYTNIPITESIAVSLSGLDYTEESYYTLAAASPKSTLPRETSRAFSAKLGLTPIDGLSAVLGYSFINTSGAMPMSLVVGHVSPLGRALGVQRQPDYQTGEDAPTYIDTKARVITADIKYSTDWFDLRGIAGDQDIKSPALADYDGSSQPIVSFESLGQFAKVKTGEFQILSNRSSWGSEWLQWIGGLYYINSSAGYDPLLLSLAPNLLQYLNAPPPGGVLDALGGVVSPVIGLVNSIPLTSGVSVGDLLNNGLRLNLEGVLDTKSTAGFFQTTVNFTDELAMTLGGRYQTEKRTLTKSTTRLAPNPDNPYQVTPLLDFGTREISTHNFSPKVVLDYKPRDQDLLYASYSKGYKSGTYNIIAIYAPTQYVKPEEVQSYELGYKTTLLDGAMRLNTAIFQNNINELQVQTISLTSGGAVRFENAGSARVRGADFDMLWELMPQTVPGLVLALSGSYLDGTYTSYRNGSGYDETSGLYFGGSGLVLGGGVLPGRDFTGNRMVRTPKISGTGTLSYSFELGEGSLDVAADVYYNSGAYFTAQNTKTAEQDAYHLVNLRVSYFYQPWGTRLTAFGKNVNNAKYYYNLYDLDFGSPSLLAPPAAYGAKLQWDF